MGVLEPIYLYATWPDAVYACINKKEACAPEEIRKKSICVEADIGAVLEKLYDRKIVRRRCGTRRDMLKY